jgi:enoyl-CoA hydratase/carnithine racemase
VGLTKRILLASEEFYANTLLEIGFLDHLVSPENLGDFVDDYAEHIAGLAPLAVQSMKSILRQVAAGAIDHELVRELSTLCLESKDLQEGFAAKREKRNPRFSGR